MEIDDSGRDYTRKYGDCVGRLTVAGKESLYMMRDLNEARDRMRGYIMAGKTAKSWKEHVLRELEGVDLDFTVPELGMINVGGSVLFMRRTVSRQWRQGFTFKSGVIVGTYVEEQLVRKHGMYHDPNREASIHATFYPEYYDIDVSLQRIMNKDAIASAISPKYYIALSGFFPYIYLGYMGKAIGKVNEQNGGVELFEQAIPLTEDITQQNITITGVFNDVSDDRRAVG